MDAARHPGRQRWRNPLVDGWEYRWNVLVALPDRSPEEVDAVLASIGTAEANTVVQRPRGAGEAGSAAPRTAPSANLVWVASVPLPELLDDMDVAVVSGAASTALVTAREGVPMVVLPATDTELASGQALAAAGVGVVAQDPTDVGPAVRALASDREGHRRVRRLARRLAVPAVLVEALGTSALRLVGGGRRGPGPVS